MCVGHVAAEIEGERMVVFGGRGEGGAYLNDTWVYSLKLDTWTLLLPPTSTSTSTSTSNTTSNTTSFSTPPARVFSSCVSVERSERERGSERGSERGGGEREVFMYGGTDGQRNLDDLWILKPCSSASTSNTTAVDYFWEKIIPGICRATILHLHYTTHLHYLHYTTLPTLHTIDIH